MAAVQYHSGEEDSGSNPRSSVGGMLTSFAAPASTRVCPPNDMGNSPSFLQLAEWKGAEGGTGGTGEAQLSLDHRPEVSHRTGPARQELLPGAPLPLLPRVPLLCRPLLLSPSKRG